MRCEGCRAEIMLGSAQCGRCGRPVIGADPGPTSGGSRLSRLLVPSTQPTPPPPSVWSSPSGSPLPPPPPPPPPPQLGAPPTVGPRAVFQAGRAARQGGQTQTKGCGCGALVWLIALISIGSAVLGVVAGRGDDEDGATPSPATTSFSAIDLRDFEGPTIAGPTVGVGTDTVHDLNAGTIAVHPLRCELPCTIAVSPVGDFDPVIRVVGLDGVVVADDDDGGEGLGSLVALTTAPAPGSELWVVDFSGDPGSYSVVVTPTVG